MLKEYLLTAGPTVVPERVMRAMAQPVLHHRAPAFISALAEVHAGLRWVFQTEQFVVLIAGSGTAGMEAAVTNFLSPGDRVLVVRAGRFGDRWAKICTAYGVAVTDLVVEAGRATDPAQVDALLERDPHICAVYSTASESSTGVAHPIKEITEVCRQRGVLSVVDAISAVGAFPLPQDAWGIDVLVAASQKALMLPPGLAMIGASDRAWARSAKIPRFYFDLYRERDVQSRGEGTAWTPPVSLVLGLAESLRMMREEGLAAIFARHARLAEATRRAALGMRCELFARESPSPSLTAISVPPGIDGEALVDRLRTHYGITISGGLDQLKGKIFRIAHMGYYGSFDVLTAISGVEMALADAGHRFELGAGVRAAEEVLRAETGGP